MINISNPTASSFRAEFGNAHSPSATVDIDVSRGITGMKPRLSFSAEWLDQHMTGLNKTQQQLLSVALNAFGGREGVCNVVHTDRGGQFNLMRPSYNAHAISYERNPSMPGVLSFLSMLDLRGKPLLALGVRVASALITQRSIQTPLQANEASILENSRLTPEAGWQKSLYAVPFLTSAGQRTSVVGNYINGDKHRFGVQNSTGQTYAVLKRTPLDKGAFAWRLHHDQPGASEQQRGPSGASQYLRDLSRSIHSLRDMFASLSASSRPTAWLPHQSADINYSRAPWAERNANAKPPLPPRPSATARSASVDEERGPDLDQRAEEPAVAPPPLPPRPATARDFASEAEHQPDIGQRNEEGTTAPPPLPPRPSGMPGAMPEPDATNNAGRASRENPKPPMGPREPAKIGDSAPAKVRAKPLYEHLGIDTTASLTDIKKAYHRESLKTHPDKNPDNPAAEEAFKTVQNAYEILINPQKRAAYDDGFIDERGLDANGVSFP